jgi:hypothetical protein
MLTEFQAELGTLGAGLFHQLPNRDNTVSGRKSFLVSICIII